MDSKIDIHQHMNCIQMDLEHICNALKKDFSKMFVDSWDFYYESVDGHFSTEKLSQRSIESTNNRLRYLGIEEYTLDLHTADLKMINKYLEIHKALLLSIDSFCCPWHRGYEKTNIDHYCLVIGYDVNGFVCYDPYLLGEERAYLTLTRLIKGYGLSYFTNSTSVSELALKDIIWENVKDEKSKDKMFKMIESFSNDLLSINQPSDLFDYPHDVYLCAITRATKFIADGRIQIGYLLGSRDEPLKENGIASISDLLFQAGDLWNHLNSIFIKIFCVPRQFENAKKKMNEYMTEIIRIEKQIYCDMKNHLNA